MMTERQARVLHLVTEHYIASAHPVASSALAHQLGVSSATVRNELASLEDAGYLMQPHTSAGRVPTLLGYQHYAERFIPPKDLPTAQRDKLAQPLNNTLGKQLLQELANAVASLSGYAVVVSLASEQHLQAAHLHLSLLADSRLVAVVVLENGIIRQLVTPLSPAPSPSELRGLEQQLQSLGIPMVEMPAALTAMAEHAEPNTRRTLRALLAAWSQLTPATVVSQGLSNLLHEPESQDPEFLQQVVHLIEQPSTALPAVPTAEPPTPDKLTLILEPQLASIYSSFRLGALQGYLRMIGPLRMRYPHSLMIARGVQDVGEAEGYALH